MISCKTTIGIRAHGMISRLSVLFPGPERPRVYSELSQEEKDRYNADIRATNIILQGLPKDIYSLINHYIDAKDIWDNVKMLLEGSELTKEDRESQLYDDFEHFRQNKEWGRLLTTAVKLNKGLKDSNFDQLYAYLKQHEAHANENKMMLERLTQQTVDPLALMSNVSHQPYHSQSSTNPPNTYHQPHSGDTSQSDLGISPTENLIENLTNTLALLTQSYKTFLPQTNNQIETSFHPRNPSYVQDGRLIVQNVQGRQNRGQGHIARNCTQPKRPQNSEYFKDKMLLMQAQENGVILDEEQSLFLAGGLDNAIDEDVMTTCSKNLALNWIMLISLSRMLLDHHDEHEEQRLWSFYDEVNKVAIGYKNPLCLHRARPKDIYSLINHYTDAKDIWDNVKMILEGSQLTKEDRESQLYDDFEHFHIVKMKAEALKEQNTRPIKALTMYPPNTPATLVPRVLPTKSQVKINIFTLRQLFSEFEKTCKKRITPTGITEGERGFEQTKTCYLSEVIPFFKTLQEHFEGIQKALTKEVKEMSDAFDELEAELDQSIVDRKHDAIERKNLLLEHDNIIADCLLKEVFYVASNSELNASRFTEMQKAHNVVKTRCLELEAELSNLRDNVHKDNYNELLNRFSNLEVNHLNLQLKYQNLKDSFQNKPSSSVNDTPDFNSVFVIGQMKASLQGKDNVIQKLKMEISQLKETRSELDRTLDFRARDFQISQLTEKVNGLQELYDSIKISRAKHIEQITALKNENESLKVQLQNTVSCVTTKQVKPNVLAACRYTKRVWHLSKGLQSTR
ncbi:hypothetical protein Tco_0753720 [Tanacetum coccineum]